MSMPKLNQPFYDRDLYDGFEKYLESKGFKYIGSGCFRNAFQRGKVVVKIPRSYCGFEDNIGEAYAYNEYRKRPVARGTYYAPCRLLSNGCLMMVYVEQGKWKIGNKPDWVKRIDSYQCGLFNGRVVAYDSGCDIGHLLTQAKRWAGLDNQTTSAGKRAAEFLAQEEYTLQDDE